jgi:hypothetical protein
MNIKKLFKEDLQKFAEKVWHKHQDHAVGDAKKFLHKQDIVAITLFTLVAAFIITFVDFLIYLRWSTFSNSNPFDAYHPYVPVLLILFNFIYIACLRMKRITFWLAYYPAILGIIYYVIEGALIYHILHPQDLMNFFSMIGLGHPPGWLIG